MISMRLASVCLGFTALSFGFSPAFAAGADSADGQIIVFLRHGEKPDSGLGQLDCKGLNRSLALPPILTKMFGRPDRIFAPDPSHRKKDSGVDYDYIRPLATIEPTAIADGLPVDTSIGYDDVAGLTKALTSSEPPARLTFVAWEHKQIVKTARSLLKASGGNPKDVPAWAGDDFDGLYVVRLQPAPGKATFERLTEGLDHLPEDCPGH